MGYLLLQVVESAELLPLGWFGGLEVYARKAIFLLGALLGAVYCGYVGDVGHAGDAWIHIPLESTSLHTCALGLELFACDRKLCREAR